MREWRVEADRNTRCWQPEDCDCFSFSNKKSRQMLEMTERSGSAVTDFSACQDPAAVHCARPCVCKLCRSAPCGHKPALTALQSSERTSCSQTCFYIENNTLLWITLLKWLKFFSLIIKKENPESKNMHISKIELLDTRCLLLHCIGPFSIVCTGCFRFSHHTSVSCILDHRMTCERRSSFRMHNSVHVKLQSEKNIFQWKGGFK